MGVIPIGVRGPSVQLRLLVCGGCARLFQRTGFEVWYDARQGGGAR